MAKGIDDLLFGQPKDLEEAVEALVAFYGEERLKEVMQDGNSLYNSKTLYDTATFIRNH